LIWDDLYITQEEWTSYTPTKRWRLTHVEENKKSQANWRKNNMAYDKQRQRKHQLKSKYNLTEEQYQLLLKEQGYVCKLCGTDKVGGKWTVFHVDHCHTTGKIRGLLCTNCNRGLGMLGDTLQSIEKAYIYMKENT